jgi:hypothetical protein
VDGYRPDWRSWFLPRRLGPQLPAESLKEPLPIDTQRIDDLRAAGSRMKVPHPIRNHLYFSSEKDARAAMDSLMAEGYSLQVRAEEEERWRVTGVIRLVPTPGSITHMRERLETVCSSLGGEYAGWESPLVH